MLCFMILGVILFYNPCSCQDAGFCDVDVFFNVEVDVNGTNDGGNQPTLLKSYHTPSPRSCISDCCDDDECTNVAYSLSSGPPDERDENCKHYNCESYECASRPSIRHYVYTVLKVERIPTVPLPTTTAVTRNSVVTTPFAESSAFPYANSSTYQEMITANAEAFDTTRSKETTFEASPSGATSSNTMQDGTTTSETLQDEAISPDTPQDETTPSDTLQGGTASSETRGHATVTTVQPTLRYRSGELNLTVPTAKSNLTAVPGLERATVPLRYSYGLLVSFVVFGFMIVLTTIYVVWSRVRESLKNYRYRHYKKIEYLIDDRKWEA